MTIADRLRDRATSLLEENLNLSIVDREELGSLREADAQFAQFRDETEDFAYTALEHMGNKTADARPERRRAVARASRKAWARDPIIGTEAEHYANFAVGRGVGLPRAKDPDVQKVINRAWRNSGNLAKLTSHDALRAISNELRTGTNIFPLFFRSNGEVRISFLDADRVINILVDEEDRFRPLYYVVQEVSPGKWDFGRDAWESKPGEVKIVYYAHWRNLEDAEEEYERGDRKKPPLKVPAGRLGKGGVHHVRVNRLLEQQFGTPYGQRTLRFASAMNRLLEARVSMEQAASSIIAKRVMRGGASSVEKGAEQILQRTGEIGASRTAAAQRAGAQRGVTPGSIRTENEQDRLEAFSLNSGSQGAVASMQLIRGAAIAPSAMGQHYFGAADSANLATAATLELPAMAAVGSHQETLELLLRLFTDIAIEEAVRNGDLGNALTTNEEHRASIRTFKLMEGEDLEEISDRLGKDLSYSFNMPFPGRRLLPEVMAAFNALMNQLSPLGENEELTKIALTYLFSNGFEFEDAADVAERITKAQQKLLTNQADQQAAAAEAQKAAADAQAAAASQQQPPAEEEPPAGPGPKPKKGGENASEYGEARKTAKGKAPGEYVNESVLPADAAEDVEAFLEEIDRLYRIAAVDPAGVAISAAEDAYSAA